MINRASVVVCRSLMVSGLGRWCRRGRRTWCHKQLPEVIIGQLGPEMMHIVNAHAQMPTEHNDRMIALQHSLCSSPVVVHIMAFGGQGVGVTFSCKKEHK